MLAQHEARLFEIVQKSPISKHALAVTDETRKRVRGSQDAQVYCKLLINWNQTDKIGLSVKQIPHGNGDPVARIARACTSQQEAAQGCEHLWIPDM